MAGTERAAGWTDGTGRGRQGELTGLGDQGEQGELGEHNGRAARRTSTPARASARDTARVAALVALPALAGGVVLRRKQGVALAARLDADRRAVKLLNELRGRYGPGPLHLRVAGRDVALPLSAEDAQRVLEETPEPFSPAAREKRAALGHFQPHGVLVSTGQDREERKAFNEDVLEAGQHLHHLAPHFVRTVREEADELLGRAGPLDWDAFGAAWWRIVRRVVLGDGARDETALTGLLARLRGFGNWAFLIPPRVTAGPRERFQRRLRAHLDRAEPGSLAEALAQTAAKPGVDPAGQVPHWMFAFDAAGVAAARTLALLATHPAQEQQVHNELAIPDLTRPQLLPYTRASVMESVRLWPTTPFLLRESTRQTRWGEGTLPEGTAFLVYAPYFHRDGSAPYGDRFVPEIWLDGTAQTGPELVPFSAGPGVCPGEDLVLLVTSTLVAALMERHDFRLRDPGRLLRPDGPLPYTFNHFALRFSVTARQ
ncbi:cytochrome P450 [Streptomyces sp. ISL-96]|uniref:cytochrome P450 n=1 Tax=Streptomyces sp. ISL-96 TaxID=2819191 RepID=UPI001BE98535|nr:cytochrome P450 [Streptomyces sp. ISL-96]MBT2491508.1 cytochrome P450 [Streptomyces sp. ISL-96]